MREARPDNSDALTDTERAIMKLYDDGKTQPEICATLGLNARQVHRVVGMYSLGKIDRWMEDARLGSFDLLRALRRHHPNRIGAAS
jgi:DNA-binding transcriptional regulator LsrR (DeoR family)